MNWLLLLIGLGVAALGVVSSLVQTRRGSSNRGSLFVIYLGLLVAVFAIFRMVVHGFGWRWVVALVLAIVIIVIAKGLFQKAGFAFVAALAVVGLLLSLVLHFGNSDNGTPSGGGQPSTSSTPSASPSASTKLAEINATKADCKIQDGYLHPLKYDPNKNQNFSSDGLSGSTAAERLKSAEALASRDPRALYYYYGVVHGGVFPSGVTSWKSLTTRQNKCLNIGGYTMLVQYLEDNVQAKSVTISQAPAKGANSGVNPGTTNPYQEPVATITGNRDAVLVVYKNGLRVWYMMRCGNPVTEGPTPNLPSPPSTPPSHSSPPSSSHPSPQCTGFGETGKKNSAGNCIKNCQLEGKSSCGPNGQDAPPVSQGAKGPTKNYPSRGNAESVSNGQHGSGDPYTPTKNGSKTNTAPAGADGGNTHGGGSAGVSAPSGTPNPGGGAAKPSTSASPSAGNPCEDPNAPGCGP